jgi:hypothetical protein
MKVALTGGIALVIENPGPCMDDQTAKSCKERIDE